jgi:hypothetical protein
MCSCFQDANLQFIAKCEESAFVDFGFKKSDDKSAFPATPNSELSYLLDY